MDFGVNLPVSSVAGTGPIVAEAARRAEELGFRAVWVGDHVVLPTTSRSRYPYSTDGTFEMDVTTPWLEPLTTLTWAAAGTRRIELGTAILVLGLRPVLLAAKQLATLDHLSGGRLVCGVGAGWLEEEFELLGQPFDRRGARLTEAIRVLRACFAEGPIVEHRGRFYDLGEFAFVPKPEQGDRVPILVGGESDAALRRVAKVGNGWLPAAPGPEELAARLEVLTGLLEAESRSLSDLRIVVQLDASDELDLTLVERYRDVGVTHLFTEISWRRGTAEDALARMEEIAAAANLRPALPGGDASPAPPSTR